MTMPSTHDPNDLSLRLDDSTRERISRISEQRKASNAKQMKADRKNTIIASTGKYTDSWNDRDVMMSPRRPSDTTPKPLRKKKSKVIKKDDDMSVSGHSEFANRETEENDDEEEKKSSNADREVKRSPQDGKLGKMLGNAKPIKKRGARTVASMPVSADTDSPVRKMNSERNERTTTAAKSRAQSPGPMKRRSASPGPMTKRSSSPGPMRERMKPSSPVRTTKDVSQSLPKKRPSLQVRSKSTTNTLQDEQNRPDDNHHSRLEELLGGVDSSDPKRKSGGASVTSAPGVVRKASRRTRPSRAPLSNRRSKSIDLIEPLVQEKAIESPKRRRARSVDDVDLELGEEDLKDDSQGPPSPKNFSYRLSKRLNSFRKLAGLGGGEKASTGREGESQGTDPEHAQKRIARAPTRSAVKPKRSNSAGPLTNRPALKREKDDRRAGLSRSKRTDSAQAKSNADGSDEEEAPRMTPQRAQSMMLHRDATRRGKSSSLMDLVNYSEEEIHSTSYFASNHVLVNRERMKRGLRPLTRNIAMDELARENAKRMAESGGVTPIPATYVGNVLRGESIRAIHRAIMQNKDGRERANVLNPYFQDFGVGTSKSEDGMLYICQLFSERLELTVTDTTTT